MLQMSQGMDALKGNIIGIAGAMKNGTAVTMEDGESDETWTSARNSRWLNSSFPIFSRSLGVPCCPL